MYVFTIVNHFRKKIEAFVWFGCDIYTSTVQCYPTLVELNNASLKKNIPVETTIKIPKEMTRLFVDGWIRIESKRYCENISNHIEQMIRISFILQLKFVLYGYIAIETVSYAAHKCQCWN